MPTARPTLLERRDRRALRRFEEENREGCSEWLDSCLASLIPQRRRIITSTSQSPNIRSASCGVTRVGFRPSPIFN